LQLSQHKASKQIDDPLKQGMVKFFLLKEGFYFNVSLKGLGGFLAIFFMTCRVGLRL